MRVEWRVAIDPTDPAYWSVRCAIVSNVAVASERAVSKPNLPSCLSPAVLLWLYAEAGGVVENFIKHGQIRDQVFDSPTFNTCFEDY